MCESVDGESVTDGSLHSYLSLPRRLFRSELNLYKSSSQATLAPDWREEDKLDPGLFGLLDDPGVLRLDFDDYPDSVYVTEEENFDRPGSDVSSNKDWIRKSYDELDVDTNRTEIEIVYNRVRYKNNIRENKLEKCFRQSHNLLETLLKMLTMITLSTFSRGLRQSSLTTRKPWSKMGSKIRDDRDYCDLKVFHQSILFRKNINFFRFGGF